ncbi:phosphate acyltransferase [Acetonema longum]|uniref:Phosphate butyryltransferase n=1 Tax=Acetonema longum DSM 6540 TaxID=1009370 RepID=F7NFR5_9FIRM|nr:phosphate acyltransferase [Acetonema longum]EGO65128.1 Phosphate butyryltransferase [Acetonema longum DSM 6540]
MPVYANFAELLAKAKLRGKKRIAVAVAQDKDVLEAIKAAQDQGIIAPVLVGNASLIVSLIQSLGLPGDTPVIDEPDDTKAALAAVSLVHAGKADILMKGLVNSSIFLKAILDPEMGLRTGRLLSHLVAFEIPGTDKLVFHTDGGMNVAPNLAEKKDILMNSLQALKYLGIEQPNVAVLAANEMVNPKIPATTDAKALADMNANKELTPGIIEGPIAMDVAVSPEAAKHKGLSSKISGKADLFLMPSIEAGNLVGKTLTYYARAKIAGIIVGAAHPVVMTSRADSPEAKLNSIAFSCLATPFIQPLKD